MRRRSFDLVVQSRPQGLYLAPFACASLPPSRGPRAGSEEEEEGGELFNHASSVEHTELGREGGGGESRRAFFLPGDGGESYCREGGLCKKIGEKGKEGGLKHSTKKKREQGEAALP